MRIAQFEASHPVSLKARASVYLHQHKLILFAVDQYQRFDPCDLGDFHSSMSP